MVPTTSVLPVCPQASEPANTVQGFPRDTQEIIQQPVSSSARMGLGREKLMRLVGSRIDEKRNVQLVRQENQL